MAHLCPSLCGHIDTGKNWASSDTGETSSTSPHAADSAQPHRRARLRAHITMHTMARTNMTCWHTRTHCHAVNSGFSQRSACRWASASQISSAARLVEPGHGWHGPALAHPVQTFEHWAGPVTNFCSEGGEGRGLGDNVLQAAPCGPVRRFLCEGPSGRSASGRCVSDALSVS